MIKIIVISLMALLLLNSASAQCDGNNTFLGTSSSDWNTASNWSANCVPDGTITGDIVIASNCIISNFAFVTFTGGFQINGGKTFTLSGSAILEFLGTVSGSGTFIGDQQIDGALYPGDFIPPPPQTGTITYGGQTYNTILMPDGNWWMAENLNIGTMINGSANQTNNSTIEKYCYGNNAANCNTYGGLYQWNEMMLYSTIEGSQGICPSGWHLPSDAEWTELESSLPSPDKGSRLAGNAGLWTNGLLNQSQFFGLSGFESLPAGSHYTTNSYQNQNSATEYWSSTMLSTTYAAGKTLQYDYTEMIGLTAPKVYSFSVRCVQN